MNNKILVSLEEEALTKYLGKLSPKVAAYLNDLTKNFSPKRNEIIAKLATVLLDRYRQSVSFNDVDTLRAYLKTLKAANVGEGYFWDNTANTPVFEGSFEKLFICLYNSIINRNPSEFYLVSLNGKVGLCVEINEVTINLEKWGLA